MAKTFCQQCGAEHPDTSLFCSACGTKLLGVPGSVARANYVPPMQQQAPVAAFNPPTWPKPGVIAAIVGAFVLLPIIGIAAAIAIPTYLEKVKEAKLTEIQDGASTWVSLCSNSSLENRKICGDFVSLGFVPPGASETKNHSDTKYFSYQSGPGVLLITSKTDLPSCPKGSTWKLWMTVDEESYDSSFIIKAETNPEDCADLSSTFSELSGRAIPWDTTGSSYDEGEDEGTDESSSEEPVTDTEVESAPVDTSDSGLIGH